MHQYFSKKKLNLISLQVKIFEVHIVTLNLIFDRHGVFVLYTYSFTDYNYKYIMQSGLEFSPAV